MTDKELKALSPHAQRQYLDVLLSKLTQDLREAAQEVAQWLATERRLDEVITPQQITLWIEDVRTRNASRNQHPIAMILPFRRT